MCFCVRTVLTIQDVLHGISLKGLCAVISMVKRPFESNPPPRDTRSRSRVTNKGTIRPPPKRNNTDKALRITCLPINQRCVFEGVVAVWLRKGAWSRGAIDPTFADLDDAIKDTAVVVAQRQRRYGHHLKRTRDSSTQTRDKRRTDTFARQSGSPYTAERIRQPTATAACYWINAGQCNVALSWIKRGTIHTVYASRISCVTTHPMMSPASHGDSAPHEYQSVPPPTLQQRYSTCGMAQKLNTVWFVKHAM